MITLQSIVEVFRTDVEEPGEADMLSGLLLYHFPGCRVSFDLEDCDRILRVEGNFDPDKIMLLIGDKGYNCSVLE